MRKSLTKIFWHIEVWAVQKHVNLVDLVKSFPTNIFLQSLASIPRRTSRTKFDHGLKNQSKVRYRTFELRSLFLLMGAADLRLACDLVERFDIEPYSDFPAKWSNFRGLALFYIETDFCNKYLFFSIFRDLQDCHTFAPLQIENRNKNSWNYFASFQYFCQKNHF